MSATMTEFYARVSRQIRRGTLYDTDIPAYAQAALEVLEGKHRWQHSRVFLENFTLLANTQDITPASESVALIRSIRFLRFRFPATDGQGTRFFYIHKGKLEDFSGSYPASSMGVMRYAMTSRNTLRLSHYFTDDKQYDLLYYVLPPLLDSNPWLVWGEDIWMSQTIIQMAPLLRDDKLIARHKVLVEDNLPSMIESQLDHEWDSDDGGDMVPFSEELGLEEEWRFDLINS